MAYFLSAATKFLLVVLVICMIYSGSTQKQIADSVVRLHIVANSDSPQDQALKLKVRDAILEHMQVKYPNGATREEAANYLKNSLPEIKQIASNVLLENGSHEAVNARYGVFPFPTKEYGNVALPAGMYEAVRVELGSAEGKNWWCVMFPPLCVADANTLKMDENAQNELKQGLGAGNYGLVTDITDKSNVPVKVKFRIVELVESTRIKLAQMISNLF
ncbi:MAG: stage II sporulation protein R [Clostridia bacterium]|nr:stage II sporulation protein R [Clostridia bacterium]